MEEVSHGLPSVFTLLMRDLFQRVTRTCLLLVLFLGLSSCHSSPVISDGTTVYIKQMSLLGGDLDRLESLIEARLGEASLPSPRDRRLTLPEAPKLKMRDFFGLSTCSLSGLIAYRNSPLGRVQLSSQQLAYEHRFLKESARCDLSQSRPELKEVIALAISFKRNHWSKFLSNATWGGREIGRFLSVSAPRDFKVRRFNSVDESNLAWLAQLTPDDPAELSSLLEKRLKSLPSYVGGSTIVKTSQYLALLAWSKEILTSILEQAHMVLMEKPSNHLCLIMKGALSAFSEIQGEVSESYQSLMDLSRSLELLSKMNKKQASRSMKQYLNRWANSSDASAVREFRELSRENVRLWAQLFDIHQCGGALGTQ